MSLFSSLRKETQLLIKPRIVRNGKNESFYEVKQMLILNTAGFTIRLLLLFFEETRGLIPLLILN